MTSEKKIEANRLNAQRSTGPRSEEGKARVSRNPMRHGLCSRDVLLAQEDAGEFAELLRQFVADLQPRDLLERIAVDRIAGEYWRLGRASRLERDWMEAAMEEEAGLIEGLFKDEDPAAVPSLRLGDAVKHDFCEGLFDRLRRYEGRLDRSLGRQLAELAKLRKRKDEELAPDTSSHVDANQDSPAAVPDSRGTGVSPVDHLQGRGAHATHGPAAHAAADQGAIDPQPPAAADAETLPAPATADSAESQGHGQASGQAQAAAQCPASHGSQTTGIVAPGGLPSSTPADWAPVSREEPSPASKANRLRLAAERIARDGQRVRREDKPATRLDGRGRLEPTTCCSTITPALANRDPWPRAEQSQTDRPKPAERRKYTPEENAYLHQRLKEICEKAKQRELAIAAGDTLPP